MALSKTYILKEETLVANGIEYTSTTTVADFRKDIVAARERPENIYKTKYLTRGELYSGFSNNDISATQQFVSLAEEYEEGQPNPEVIGYFEYDIALIEDTTSRTSATIATYDAEGNILEETTETPQVVFTNECMATIHAMINYAPQHFLTFGADLYNILEHCFLEPVPVEVYKKLLPDDQEQLLDLENNNPPTISRVEWLVFRGNPAELLYDKLVVKMGGHIIPPQRAGQLKKYVLTKEEFM
jgi:hypothetical protein